MRGDGANRLSRTKWFVCSARSWGTRPRRKPSRERRRRANRSALEFLESRVPLAADLLISEFMAVNQSGLKDEDGDVSDWIEIFNSGGQEVDLKGWHLTDDPDQLRKWEFPAVELGPGRGLVVFASNKDRDAAGAELHTNFRLSSDGEYLALVSPDGSTIVDQYDPYPQQYADVSYGPEQLQTTTTVLAETEYQSKAVAEFFDRRCSSGDMDRSGI